VVQGGLARLSGFPLIYDGPIEVGRKRRELDDDGVMCEQSGMVAGQRRWMLGIIAWDSFCGCELLLMILWQMGFLLCQEPSQDFSGKRSLLIKALLASGISVVRKRLDMEGVIRERANLLSDYLLWYDCGCS